MFLEQIERVTAPIVPIALPQVVIVHVLLDVGFIGAYFLGHADGDCPVIQQFTDRRIQFVQFQTCIDILLAPSEAANEWIHVVPALFKQAFEGFRFLGGAYLLTL